MTTLTQMREAADLLPADSPVRKELIADLESELAIADELMEQMASILTRSVNAIRGEPGPLQRHSWHDLPELIDGLKVDLLEALLDKEMDETK